MFRRRATLAALVILLAAPIAAQGQDPLTESDLTIWAVLLEAQIRQAEQTLQMKQGTYEGQRLIDEFSRARPDIERGTVDMLAWIESHSRKMPVPPGATYLPGCSRYVTRLLVRSVPKDELPTRPVFAPVPVVAVFTFGIPAGGAIDHLRDNPNADGPRQRMNAVSAEAASTVERASAFFMRNGFTVSGATNNFARDGLQIYLYSNAILNRDGLSTKMLAETAGRTFEPDSPDARECSRVESGPLFWVELLGLPGEHPQSHWDEAVGRVGFEGRNMGWQAIQSAVNMARDDIENPEFSGLRELEQLVAEYRDESYREQLAARRRNIELYRRHEARLAPLYAELERLRIEVDRAHPMR